MLRPIAAVSLLFTVSAPATAADWPAQRGNAARSGFTEETLPTDLEPAWTYRAAHPPAPAWPRDDRMQFDWAFRPVVADGTLFFGSSVDGRVYALDAKTGETQWTYATEGPVRFAPVVWKDRLFVGSDDGFLHCVSLADGSLIFKQRGGQGTERVLGNGRIVSRLPVRGGPVIFDNTLYYAAGIWQSEGIHIHAVDPATGKRLWTNDSSGGIEMPQPHGGAVAKSGVSAQGHLVATESHLFVPTGRAVPAVFDRKTGKFLYYHLQANGHRGGTAAFAHGLFLYNGGYAYDTQTGTTRTRFGSGAMAAWRDVVLGGSGNALRAFKPILKDSADRKGNPIKVPDHEAEWKIDLPGGGFSLIVAGNAAAAGASDKVLLVDLKTKKLVKSLKVDGIPYALAAADGRLFVSTDRGTIHCFAADAPAEAIVRTPDIDKAPYGGNDLAAAAAKTILETTGVTEGYCVDLGCGDGALAFELARNSELRVIAIDSDAEKVVAARKKLAAAGLYGARVSVFHGDPSDTKFPKYVANLVASARALTDGVEAVNPEEVRRLQRPYGGYSCLGKAGNLLTDKRGPLANAGSWSHLYADPANTGASADEVKGPLRTLWYRDVDLELPQRHGRGPAPLFHGGRLFAEGLDELRAVDAYNGRTLWTFELPGILRPYDADHIVGASQTGSNFCVADEGVYARQEGHCFRLDPATGKVLGKFPAPKRKDGKPSRWGYLACEDGILFGSVVDEEHIVRHAWRRADAQMKQLFTESHFLFAMDAETGELLWRYDAEKSLRHNAIAVGDGRVFLIDRALAKDDLLSRASRRRGEPAPPKAGHPTGVLVTLDAKTGKRLWDNDKDIFGTVLAFSDKYDMLLMSYQSTRFKLPSEIGGRMAVFRATEGYRVWDKKVNYVTRPLVNDRTIYAQGGAWDLLTGEDRPFEFKRSYGCGQIAASKHLLLFRSATLGYKDLLEGGETQNFGGVRPGCWINALPAGGLVLLPDASAGCQCSYQNRSWLALQGAE